MHVIYLTLPEITEFAGTRRHFGPTELERIKCTFPRQVVVFAGSWRQDDSEFEPAPSPQPGASSRATNCLRRRSSSSTPSPRAGGILAR
ncbi:hypothetical protein EDB92DRAFT_1941175 [Lactarius akahatsu]|uniref:Uncharacterized protein n=1 Tax=Lactarius akahatsu TaxID=416441 RepID=A0AAD4LPU6_9AGAM|nr:hypothetical protein EDB92DRAFT_1941175 [Lactarius akahatsu]